jgi:phosphatidate cytidylyltransferase
MSPAVTRIIIGAGMIAATVAILGADVFLAKAPGFPKDAGFWILLMVVLWQGGSEFFGMLRHKGHPARPIIGLIFIALLVAAAWLDVNHPDRVQAWLYERGLELYLLIIVGLVFITFVAEIVRIERRASDMGRALASVGWTVLVVLTVGLLGVFLAKIRFLSPDPKEGLMYLALVLGVVKGSDIGAYAIGSWVGRHKLVPTLSPKKTVEGLFGGLAAGMLAAILIGCLWCRFEWWQMVLFGLAVSIAGLLGDLAESLIKRACGVKDSGPIPGFGGALDILDSMLAAAPVAYLALVVLTGPVQ